LANLQGLPFATWEGADLEEKRLDAIDAQMAAGLALGRYDHIVDRFRLSVMSNPTRAGLVEKFVTATFYGRGKSAAITAYESLISRSEEVRGATTPDPELSDLLVRITNDEMPSSPSPDHSVGVGPSGRPGASRRSSPRVQQLPPDVPRFVGRQVELARLREMMKHGHPGTMAISAIAGAAGVGKTALAVHLARELAPRFPDGQLYLNMHGYEPGQRLHPSQALDRLLRALGETEQTLPTDVEGQRRRYQELLADKHALVVLDNVASAEEAWPLLPESPTCHVLVTSRHRLGGLVSEGAALLVLDALSPEEALELLSGIAGGNRLRAEREAAARLVRLCGYLPLAISIAGAHLATLPIMSIAGFAAELTNEEKRLGKTVAMDVEVRATFALSYGALADDAARILRLLGLVEGPSFGTGAAAALSGATFEEAEAVLGTLVKAHLVQDGPVPGRYRFHDLLRTYAREKVEAEESHISRGSPVGELLRWYLDTADVAGRLVNAERPRLPYEAKGTWEGPRLATTDQALAWFEAERASLVAATRQARDLGLNEVAWQLADALFNFFTLRKHWGDWKTTHSIGLDAAVRQGDQRAEASMLAGLGHVNRELRHLEGAVDCYERSLEISRTIGDRKGEARAVSGLGHAYREQGWFDRAVAPYEQTLAIRRETDDRYHEGVTLSNLGQTYFGLGDIGRAIQYYEQALAIHHEIKARPGEGIILHNLGDARSALKEFDKAIDDYKRSLAISRESGNRHGEGLTLESLGLALEETHDMAAARACWREARLVLTELGAPEADRVGARLEG